MITPENINPVQWQDAVGVARHGCARIFRDGGAPGDALRAFGLADGEEVRDWDRVVEMIARAMCDQVCLRKAA